MVDHYSSGFQSSTLRKAGRNFYVLLFFAAIFFGAISLVVDLLLPALSVFSRPSLAVLFVMVTFYLRLRHLAPQNLMGEIGLVYVALIGAYTLFPALGFAVLDLDQAGPFVRLFPEKETIGDQLWRQVLFLSSFSIGYLLFRGCNPTTVVSYKWKAGTDRFTLVFLAAFTLVCISVVLLFSAPVETYYEHYTRYDHLHWLVRKFVSVCIRLNLALYSFLLVFLFLNYNRFKKIIPFVVVLICYHEVTYSLGSRIQTLVILLQAICLYTITVKPISIKRGVFWAFFLVALFSMIELIRIMQFDLGMVKESIDQDGVQSASEFGAVFLTAFHLYAERASGSLPPVEWQMFFYDFTAMVTFGDFLQWNPTSWYASNYFPASDVAPYTLGPIANSAVWGGEIDLFFRGLVNGLFFCFIVRKFIKYRSRWWALGVYSYCYATCILTLKYSVFYHLTPLIKTMVPCILIIAIFRMLVINNIQRKFVQVKEH